MKVLKNYLLNSSYQLLVVIIPIITIPYISRVLGPKGIGVNTFTYAIIQYFILFGSIGISTYGNREIAYNQGNKAKRSQLFWEISFLRFITIGLSIIAFGIFLYFQKANVLIYALQGLAILAAGFDISWYFMGVENFKRTVGRNFIVSILSVICIFLFVKRASDLPLYVAIAAGTPLIGNLSLWPYLRKEVFAPKWHKLSLKRHLYPTMLLFLPQIATQIYLVVNKSMIGIFHGTTASGYFGQADSIIKVTLSLVTSLGTVMLPHVSSMHAQGDFEGIKKMLKKSFDLMTGLAIPIMFGIMAISVKFAPFFFGHKWEVVGPLMVMEAPIVIFIAWSNVLGVQYLLPLNRMKEFTTSVTLGAILNIIINVALIPSLGVPGAMIATVIAEFSVTAYQFYVLRHDFDIAPMILKSWKYFLSGLIMFLVVSHLSAIWKMNLRNFMLQVLIGGMIYIISNILLKSNLFLEVKKVLPTKK